MSQSINVIINEYRGFVWDLIEESGLKVEYDPDRENIKIIEDIGSGNFVIRYTSLHAVTAYLEGYINARKNGNYDNCFLEEIRVK